MSLGEIGMRTLTNDEVRAILMLAAEVQSTAERDQLLADLKSCTVEATVPDGSILAFSIAGYQRPPSHGEGQYRAKDGSEVAGVVKDADGAEMEVILLADVNRRVWEFEIVRFHPGPVIKPDWNSFKVR